MGFALTTLDRSSDRSGGEATSSIRWVLPGYYWYEYRYEYDKISGLQVVFSDARRDGLTVECEEVLEMYNNSPKCNWFDCIEETEPKLTETRIYNTRTSTVR